MSIDENEDNVEALNAIINDDNTTKKKGKHTKNTVKNLYGLNGEQFLRWWTPMATENFSLATDSTTVPHTLRLQSGR